MGRVHHDEEQTQEYGHQRRPRSDEDGEIVEGEPAGDGNLAGWKDYLGQLVERLLVMRIDALLRSSNVELHVRFIVVSVAPAFSALEDSPPRNGFARRLERCPVPRDRKQSSGRESSSRHMAVL